MAERRTEYVTCPLCEATCGLELALEGDTVVRIRGDRDDVFSHGFLCPKGTTLGHLQDDPDRLRTPLVRRDGELVPATWDEAFEEVERRLAEVREQHGDHAVALYAGNPTVHTLAGTLLLRPLLLALRTRNLFSASTVDQMPKHVSSGFMFGDPLTIPVPDLDRTDHLLILGANPMESNGSLCTAPDFPGRLAAIRERGGKVVVVDPRRTKTAEKADEHVFIRPGTDALLLAAIARTLFDDDLVDLGRLEDFTDGVGEVREALEGFTPEAVSPVCGIDAATIRRMAHELAEAPTAAVYGRIGTCTVEFGTLASWLVDVVNALTGNLDRPGGAMFPAPAHSRRRSGPGGRGFTTGRWHSRVKGYPEVFGQFPVATLADEIETPGDGQIRALVVLAGNPVLSNPNSARLDAAMASLDFLVSVDIYVNETNRHAHVILPAPGALAESHYDLAFYALAVRNVANWSAPVVPVPDGMLPEWEVMARLALAASGMTATADVEAFDDLVVSGLVSSHTADPASPIHGRDVGEIVAALGDRRGPERLVDFMLRVGPYGDGFGAGPGDLSLDLLERHPHGVDLGPLQPSLPDALTTPDGRVHLAPPEIVADVPRLAAALDRRTNGELLLVGRRDLRSNNSWMHNIPVLVKGKRRCTLHVHPGDAARLGLADGVDAEVASAAGKIRVPVEVTPDVMEGVVSMPHGWGHDVDGVGITVAKANAGVNFNILSDDSRIDPLSGNAVLNAVPVHVAPA
ncbi:MAG TPA: molybdopterin-dependent oxidoreductase [Acidimicrobiia bacterium]|nr:molybdopterin-dependent oxidoreductase [Acidimicrobiia bacterium]